MDNFTRRADVPKPPLRALLVNCKTPDAALYACHVESFQNRGTAIGLLLANTEASEVFLRRRKQPPVFRLKQVFMLCRVVHPCCTTNLAASRAFTRRRKYLAGVRRINTIVLGRILIEEIERK